MPHKLYHLSIKRLQKAFLESFFHENTFDLYIQFPLEPKIRAMKKSREMTCASCRRKHSIYLAPTPLNTIQLDISHSTFIPARHPNNADPRPALKTGGAGCKNKLLPTLHSAELTALLTD